MKRSAGSRCRIPRTLPLPARCVPSSAISASPAPSRIARHFQRKQEDDAALIYKFARSQKLIALTATSPAEPGLSDARARLRAERGIVGIHPDEHMRVEDDHDKASQVLVRDRRHDIAQDERARVQAERRQCACALIRMQFGDGLAVLGDDKDLARGHHLVHQGEAAGLEFGGLDDLVRSCSFSDNRYDHDHDHDCT